MRKKGNIAYLGYSREASKAGDDSFLSGLAIDKLQDKLKAPIRLSGI